MLEAKRMKLSTINDLLPPEMIEKILKHLSFKEIRQAQLVCRRWKGIIDNGNLLMKAAGIFRLWIHSTIL